MSEYSAKVHRNPGGDTLVVEAGGKIEVQEGAQVTGLTGAAALATASAAVLGGVKAAARTPETDTVEAKIGTDQKLYVPAYPAEYTLPAATEVALGGVKAAANQADVSVDATLDTLRAAYIDLIAKLKAAGIMSAGSAV